ncbi:helix-turn-helix domain-containing protein [Bradyrhizobium sp. CCGUVB23]|uniref:helix-turn-helix domain-containing protein n=1 Tax=Bradyrhizobium sp. CCGUVB23 TaxID=2949630 RepID=UPI0020B183C1|nr:helix-turn-helix domain-containing protein [Bradyrhizobium sp. CCGUVB23]MCP3463326.1 helix-turn-helix domain-containing protein [Bradyrhizobium sp. CCGUVB23]
MNIILRKRLHMLFNTLSASSSLDLLRYVDIDHFRESERYASAESIPLMAGHFAVLRASLALPSCSLSLVRTFPRIINGYDLSGRLMIVVPMNEISSTRVNGKEVGQSLILLKGRANCTVYEPESRLVAILSIRPEALHDHWLRFDQGHVLLRLPDMKLAGVQMLVRGILETAANQPEAVRAQGLLEAMQATLFSCFDDAMSRGQVNRRCARTRYKEIVDRVDRAMNTNWVTDLNCERLADEIGISVRTMHTAVHAVCGSSPHRYGQLKRLWAVRRQLRNGAPGLTVRASAFAHGFWHMGDFSRLYRETLGELPSQTLANARRPLA